jgi:hypothetical protein
VAAVAQGRADLAAGIRTGVIAMVALAALGLLAALAIPALSGARLRRPDLDGWLEDGEQALPSPATVTHLRPSVDDETAEPLVPWQNSDR